MSQVDMSSGIHQLPADCYPPTDSDDESFVVLERCLGPDAPNDIEHRQVELLSSDVIDQSLEMAADVLAESSNSSLLPVPSVPKIERPEWANSISSDLSHDEIQRKVDSLIDENSKLKATLHQNNMVMKTQYETLIQWQKDVEKVHESHKKKFFETKIYIRELQRENARLIELSKTQSKQTPGASFVDVSSDLEAKNRVSELEAAMTSLKLECEKKVTELNKESKEHQYALAQLLDDSASLKLLKAKMTEQEVQFDQKKQLLLERITALKVTNEKLKANQGNPEEVALLTSQLSAAQACITDLKQAQKVILAEIEEKRIEVTKMESLLTEMKTDADRTVALEQQLAMYKADFEEERESKNKSIIEKNQLIDDFQNLQRRNEQLLEEVESLRAKSTFVEVNPNDQAPSAPSGGGNRNPTPSPPPMTYTCPLCLEKFRLLRVLEEHVESCIVNSAMN